MEAPINWLRRSAQAQRTGASAWLLGSLLAGLCGIALPLMAGTGDYYLPVGSVTFPSGSGPGQLDAYPSDMALLPSGEIATRDGTRIHVLDESLVVQRSFACGPPNPTDLPFPDLERVRPIAADESGNIYAPCEGVGLVKFNSSGGQLQVLAQPGVGTGQYRLLTDLSFANSGELLASDDGRWRILVFNQSGSLVREISLGARPEQGASHTRRLRALPDGPTGDIAVLARDVRGVVEIQYRRVTGELLELGGSRMIGLPRPPGYDTANQQTSLDLSVRALAYAAGRYIAPLQPSGGGVGLRDLLLGTLADLRGNANENVIGAARGDGGGCGGDYPLLLGSGDIIACGERYRRTGRVLRNVVSRPPLVEIRRVEQRVGSTLVDIDYRVRSDVGGVVDVFLFAEVDGQRTPQGFRRLTLAEGSGANQGPSQPTNAVRRLVWDPAADLGVAQGIGSATIAAVARRGTSLMEFRFVTIPAGVPSSAFGTALEISATPVFDFELIPVWQFLVASGNPAVAIQGGNLVRASDGVILVAADGGITASGRSHLLATAGVRAATPAEADRARQGASVGEQYYGSTHSLVLSPVSMNEVGVDMQCPASIPQCAQARTSGVLVVPL